MLEEKKDKEIKIENFSITENIVKWYGTTIQLDNVSFITKVPLNTMPLPWMAILLCLVGILLLQYSPEIGIVLIIVGGVWLYKWYATNQELKKKILLSFVMNSGDRLQILFQDKNFLDEVLNIMEGVMKKGNIGKDTITVNINDCDFSGNAQVLNDLRIKNE